MNIFKMVFGRKKIEADIQTEADIAELQQIKMKKVFRDAALTSVQQSLKIGVITKAQAALLMAHMKVNPSLRTILDKHIEMLDANGESEHAALIRELDTELFKGCVSPGSI